MKPLGKMLPDWVNREMRDGWICRCKNCIDAIGAWNDRSHPEYKRLLGSSHKERMAYWDSPEGQKQSRHRYLDYLKSSGRTCGGRRPCAHYEGFSSENGIGRCRLDSWETVGTTSHGSPVTSKPSRQRDYCCERHIDRVPGQSPIPYVVGYAGHGGERGWKQQWPSRWLDRLNHRLRRMTGAVPSISPENQSPAELEMRQWRRDHA